MSCSIKLNRFFTISFIIGMVLLCNPNVGLPQEVMDLPQRPGEIEKTGTFFQITNSEYLNVALLSSEQVHVKIVSVPDTVLLQIEPVNAAASTWIQLSGFIPLTTYYKYDDHALDYIEMTTNENGEYSYTHDLTQSQLIMIRPQPNTIYVPSDPYAGTWNSSTMTYTLTSDVYYDRIIIEQDDFTLDGNGHTLSFPGYNALYASNRTGVTLNNINIINSYWGIYISNCDDCTVKNINIQDTVWGVYLYFCDGNILENVSAEASAPGFGHIGINLESSNNNTLTGNTFLNNERAITLWPNCSYNTLSENTSINGIYSFFLYNNCDNNIIANNTFETSYVAISMWYGSENNYVSGNTANNSSSYFPYAVNFGIGLDHSINNNVAGNICTTDTGIILQYDSMYNTVAGNNCSYATRGIWMMLSSNYNDIIGNTLSDNSVGIEVITNSSNNQIKDSNTVRNNTTGVLFLSGAQGNTVVQNNFIDNITQAVDYGYNNIYDTTSTGGNYWSDWTTPDNDHDGFVDYPYIFLGGQDNLPWANMSGWDDTEPPAITSITVDQNPVSVNTPVLLTAVADDSGTGNSNIDSIYYSLNGGSPVAMQPTDGAYDSPIEEAFSYILDLTVPGVYEVKVFADDVLGNTSDGDSIFLVVYDPEGGFVTGGGWIVSPPGAYVADPNLEGKANFGFVSKYKKGKSIPEGQTEFMFKAGDLNFHSYEYEWLIVNASESRAQFKGSGTINGMGNYVFMIWATDDVMDFFRIRIWMEDDYGNETDVYDNGVEQSISGGSIVIHAK